LEGDAVNVTDNPLSDTSINTYIPQLQARGVEVTYGDVVAFPDQHLKSMIRAKIGKPDGDIYQSDLEGLTELHADSRGITDLTGLEHCISLTGLYLYDNQISDISSLEGLESLTALWIYSNQISDVSPLEGLTSLRELWLEDNNISDIIPLHNLSSLMWLWLDKNQISDISPLATLTSLTTLILSSNQITDIQPLVANLGLSEGDSIGLTDNPLSATSINTYIPQLEARGVEVIFGD